MNTNPTKNEQQRHWPLVGAFSYEFADLERLITSFKQYGLSAVQLGKPLLDKALANPDYIAEIRSKLEENGITIAALAGYRNIIAPDPEQRQAHIVFLKRCLQVAPLFGTPIVATETGTRHPENDWMVSPENQRQESWDLLYTALDELLAVAQQHGSVLALEGYVNNVLGTVDQMEAVLERFPTPQLQVVLDPFNYLSHDLLPMRDHVVSDFLQRFEQRFVVAHLKDVSDNGAEIDTPEFGYGVFPYKPYFDFLRTRRPDLSLILEHLPWEHVPAAIARLQQMI